MNNAGFHSVKTMALHLARREDDVEQLLETLGIDGVLLCPEVKQCPECGAWRTSFYRGKCRICSLRESITRHELACSDVFEQLPPEQKEVYAECEVNRDGRVFERAPKPPERKPWQDPTQTRIELVAYTIACEQHEIRRLQRISAALRQRLKRMRDKLEKPVYAVDSDALFSELELP